MKHFVLFLASMFFLIGTDSSAQINKPENVHPDNPSAREEYDFIRLRDPKTNEIPPFIARKEFEFASTLPKHDPFGGRLSSQTVFDWQAMGPVNQSGRVQAIGIDINN